MQYFSIFKKNYYNEIQDQNLKRKQTKQDIPNKVIKHKSRGEVISISAIHN